MSHPRSQNNLAHDILEIKSYIWCLKCCMILVLIVRVGRDSELYKASLSARCLSLLLRTVTPDPSHQGEAVFQTYPHST